MISVTGRPLSELQLTLWQLSFDLINPRAVARVKASLQVGRALHERSSADDFQQVLVQARLAGVDVVAQSELEVAHVAGGELDADGDGRARVVLADGDALAVFPAVLMRSRRRHVPGVPALSALALVGAVLASEAAAEQFVVVVVGWRVESVPEVVKGF